MDNVYHPLLEGASKRLDTITKRPNIVISTLDEGRIRVIKFDRPLPRNGLDDWSFLGVADALNDAEKDDRVLIVILTGEGEYFAAGGDLRSKEKLGSGPGGFFHNEPLSVFMRTVMRFPKILVAAVNGPTIGATCTLLAFCDVVYASETAYFLLPFSRNVAVPEFCSSVTFPLMLGTSLANEMLLLSKQLDVKRAHQIGFVSQVFPKLDFFNHVLAEVRLALLTPLMHRTLPLFKQMLRRGRWEVDYIENVYLHECKVIDNRVASGDIQAGVAAFLNSKRSRL